MPDKDADNQEEVEINSEALCEEMDILLPDFSPEAEISSEALREEMGIFLPDYSEEDAGLPWVGRASAASAGNTWSSLAISVLIHSLLALSLIFFGKPQSIASQTPPDFPQAIEVQLVSLPEAPAGAGSGAGGGTPEILEQPQASAPVEPAPIPKEVPKTRPVIEKKPVKVSAVSVMKSVKPAPPKEKEVQAESAPQPAPAVPSVQEGGSGQETVASAGSGTGAGPAGSGKNGPGGSGSLERSFGGPDGPQFLRRVMPVYPALAKRLDKEGTVLLRVTIDERGRPVVVEVVNAAGFGFDEEAVKAVKDSTFVPARREGAPVTCKAFLPVRFVLKGADQG